MAKLFRENTFLRFLTQKVGPTPINVGIAEMGQLWNNLPWISFGLILSRLGIIQKSLPPPWETTIFPGVPKIKSFLSISQSG